MISIFTDCNSNNLVMRVPYHIAVEMIFNLHDCKEKDELMKWLGRQSSPKLKKEVDNYAIHSKNSSIYNTNTN